MDQTYILILYVATYLNWLMSFVLFCFTFWWHHEFFLYIIFCHIKTVTVLFLPFQIGFLIFLNPHLIVVARTFTTVLSKSGHLCLIPGLKRNFFFSFSQFSIILVVNLSYMLFAMLSYIPSILILLKFLIINGSWIFQKFFMYLLRLLYEFTIKFVIWHIIIHRYWIILAYLGYIPLDHGVWFFYCITG